MRKILLLLLCLIAAKSTMVHAESELDWEDIDNAEPISDINYGALTSRIRYTGVLNKTEDDCGFQTPDAISLDLRMDQVVGIFYLKDINENVSAIGYPASNKVLAEAAYPTGKGYVLKYYYLITNPYKRTRATPRANILKYIAVLNTDETVLCHVAYKGNVRRGKKKPLR